jgi:hypothetical protein
MRSRKVLKCCFAAHHGFERSANGNFRFPVAHVAADQTVHRLGPFHVALRLDDRAHLVRCFLVNKRAFEFALPRVVRSKTKTRL